MINYKGYYCTIKPRKTAISILLGSGINVE